MTGTSIARRHELAGWWGIAVFASLGVALELLHGFKVGWYLDLANETRRHLLTLAHAHGTLVALVNLVFSSSAQRLSARSARPASACLLAALVLLPAGFLLGGLAPSSGDPGIGILAVPFGAAALVAGAVLAALAVTRERPTPP